MKAYNNIYNSITGNTCRLTELLDLYLGEVEFLYFEIAQMIIYNLKRLEKMEEYKVDLEIKMMWRHWKS